MASPYPLLKLSCFYPTLDTSGFTTTSLIFSGSTAVDRSTHLISKAAVRSPNSAIAEHGHLGPLLIFIFIWSTLVYNLIACWIWNASGSSSVLGNLDFAGGVRGLPSFPTPDFNTLYTPLHLR